MHKYFKMFFNYKGRLSYRYQYVKLSSLGNFKSSGGMCGCNGNASKSWGTTSCHNFSLQKPAAAAVCSHYSCRSS